MKYFNPHNSTASTGNSPTVRVARPAGAVTFLASVKLLLLLALGTASTATATTWYVDSTASGSKNGTSWANAWSSISSISGVKAGDVVYISGGPSGSSQTYSIGGTWAPAGGSSGNPITYQIGQDSSHNGTAVFTGGNGGYWLTPNNYTVVTGNAGDGNMHFSVSGSGGCVALATGASGIHVAYVNFGNIGAGVDESYPGGVNFEFDHCYIYINNMTADHFMNIYPMDANYDGTLIHDNTVFVPRQSGSGLGADAIQPDGQGGWSLYSNNITGYVTSYTGAQHQDGVQTLAGSYIKIHDNVFTDLANSAIFLDGYGGTFTHARIYNNVCQHTSAAYNTSDNGAAGIDLQPDGGPVQTPGFSDVIVDNNLIADITGGPPGVEFGSPPGSDNGNPGAVAYTSCYMYNNVTVNSGSAYNYGSPVTMGNNVSLSIAQGQAAFAQYKSLAPGNNYSLTSGAAALIGQGVNESSYFVNDMEGNTRPATGAWEVGPYMYGSSSGPPAGPTLSLSAVTANALDVDPNTAGLQVYEGTTVQFSATATATGTNTVGWQWSYTVNGGAPVFVQSGTGSVPSESFNFATGTGGKTYVWTVAASNGVTTVSSSLTMSVETPPAPNTSLTFQATSGTITAPFVVTGNYVSQPNTTTTISGDGEAAYTFSITNAGNYVIQALVNAPNDSANSLYVNIDAQPVDPTMCWDIFPFTTNFQNRIVSWRGTGTDTNNQYIPKIFALTTGTHQIIFAGREANTELQSFSILELPATPQNLRILPNVSGTAPSFSAGP